MSRRDLMLSRDSTLACPRHENLRRCQCFAQRLKRETSALAPGLFLDLSLKQKPKRCRTGKRGPLSQHPPEHVFAEAPRCTKVQLAGESASGGPLRQRRLHARLSYGLTRRWSLEMRDSYARTTVASTEAHAQMWMHRHKMGSTDNEQQIDKADKQLRQRGAAANKSSDRGTRCGPQTSRSGCLFVAPLQGMADLTPGMRTHGDALHTLYMHIHIHMPICVHILCTGSYVPIRSYCSLKMGERSHPPLVRR